MSLTLRDMEAALLGKAVTPVHRNPLLGMVRTDSRRIWPGDVFFCLRGETSDGHDYARAALDLGAALVVSHKDLPGLEQSQVLRVDDTLAALGRLARWKRDRTSAKVLAVTGTAGKTSVKEMLSQVAARQVRVCKNYKNFNNQIGLPLAILAAEDDADLWVLELGISRQGDMDELGVIAAPDLVLIHNIGPAHLEGLGDLEGVAKAKASLLTFLAPGGKALVSSDYPLLADQASRLAQDIVWFSSKDRNAAYFCGYDGATPEGQGRYTLRTPEFKASMVLDLCGEHWAENMAGVACAAGELGLTRETLLEGVSAFRPTGQRFACAQCPGGTLIDDSYNANPLSMLQAVRAARTLAQDRPLVLILGDMKELGEEAEAAHVDLGRELRDFAPDALFFQGDHAPDVARGFGPGKSGNLLHSVQEPEEVLAALDGLCLERPVILVKGSRSCRMERYVEPLRQRLSGPDPVPASATSNAHSALQGDPA